MIVLAKKHRIISVPTALDDNDPRLAQALQYMVCGGGSSTYSLTLTASPTQMVINPNVLTANTINVTVSTLENGSGLPDQSVDVTINRDNGQHNVKVTTGTSGTAVIPLYTLNPQTMTISASWLAPDGMHQAQVSATWVKSTPSNPSSGSTISPPTLPDALAAIDGEVVDYSFRCFIPVAGPSGTFQNVYFTVDTGAFEIVLMGSTAQQLGLPNEGSTTIEEVAGTTSAYYSSLSLKLNSTTFTAVPCIVVPNAISNLFGFRFFSDNSLQLLIQTQSQSQKLWIFPSS